MIATAGRRKSLTRSIVTVDGGERFEPSSGRMNFIQREPEDS